MHLDQRKHSTDVYMNEHEHAITRTTWTVTPLRLANANQDGGRNCLLLLILLKHFKNSGNMIMLEFCMDLLNEEEFKWSFECVIR